MASTVNTQLIQASPERLYAAFTEPRALEEWLVPGSMTGKVHHFDLREGGGYTMSLFYPSHDAAQGKSGMHEDRYTAVFRELRPHDKVVLGIEFDTEDPAMQGTMVMEVTFVPQHGADEGRTLVTIAFRDIPRGIRPEDNETGTRSSLEKLERYVTSRA